MGAGGAGLARKWGKVMQRQMNTPGNYLAHTSRVYARNAFAAFFILGNLLNQSFSGQYMWENEEGHKFDVKLPSNDPRGRATYIHMNKKNLEALEFLSIIDREKYPIPGTSRALSKATVPGRMINQLVNNQSWFGPVFAADEDIVTFSEKILKMGGEAFMPIGLKKILGYGGQELGALFGGEERRTQSLGHALLSSAGFAVKKGKRMDWYPGKTYDTSPDLASALSRTPYAEIDRALLTRNIE